MLKTRTDVKNWLEENCDHLEYSDTQRGVRGVRTLDRIKELVNSGKLKKEDIWGYRQSYTGNASHAAVWTVYVKRDIYSRIYKKEAVAI